MLITKEQIENIALLSKLYVDDSEMDTLALEMQQIIDFADTVNDFSQSSDEVYDNNSISNAFRKDEVKESYDKDEILKNASDVGNDHFLVRKRA